MASLLSFLVLVSVSEHLHQHSEAIPQINRSRVLYAYSSAFNTCKEISDSSSPVSKSAADRACEQAFEALDRSSLNVCNGWRHAGCRLISGQNYRQCTFLVSFCDDLAIRSKIPKPFHECAPSLWSDGERLGARATPTENYQQRRSKYDEALQEAQARRLLNRYGGARASTAIYYSGGAGTSCAVQPIDIAGSSSVPVHTSDYENLLFQSLALRNERKRFRCHVCNRRYTTRANLKEHMKKHTTDRTKCPVCQKVLATKGSLKLHLRSAHPDAPLPENSPRGKVPVIGRDREGTYTCGQCGRPYGNYSSLKDHERSHGSLDTYCFYCKMTLASKQSYRAHMSRRHPEDAKAEADAETRRFEEDNPAKCDECNKRFRNPAGLLEHKAYHDGKTTCNECGLILPRRSSLYIHKNKMHPRGSNPN